MLVNEVNIRLFLRSTRSPPFRYTLRNLENTSNLDIMLAGPKHGALGLAFKISRILQAICLISIIGMTANFVAQMVSNSISPPDVLVGTLSVVRIPPRHQTRREP